MKRIPNPQSLIPKYKKIIVTVDGPAGSGKSTIARKLAERLRLPYIDTGAMYRALTCLALSRRVAWSDVRGLERLARTARLDLGRGPGGKLRVRVNGRDVTRVIRTPELTRQVHHVASCPLVRRQMVKLQRRLGRRRGGVMEGRDIGTVVFPYAAYKLFLDADFDVRARRRFKEMRAKGLRVRLNDMKRDLRARDRRDYTRKAGPLKVAEDAVVIDSTWLTIPDVIDTISQFISSSRSRGLVS